MRIKVDNKTYGWLKTIPKRNKVYILILILLHVILGSTGVLYALFLRSTVDGATQGQAPVFWRSLIFLGSIMAFQIADLAVIRYLEDLSRSTLENHFKHRLFQAMLKKECAEISAVHSGDWMNRLTSDTGIVANGLTDIFPNVAGVLVKIVAAFSMLVIIEPKFAVVLLAASVFFAGAAWIFRKAMKPLHMAVQNSDGQLRMFLQERIASLFVVHSYGAEEQTLFLSDERADAHKNARMDKIRFVNLANTGLSLAMDGMSLFGIGYGCYLILNRMISYGTMTAMMQLLGQIQGPFSTITGYLPRFYGMLASAERLMDVDHFTNGTYEGLSREETMPFYNEHFGSLSLSHASFVYPVFSSKDFSVSYPEENKVADDITVDIRKGECVAFVGESGCGKSTALKMLMGMYRPYSGRWDILDESNTPVPDPYRYRRLFTYVPQGNYLMSGTIREVVGFGKEVDDTKMKEALKVSCCDFVDRLDDGLDTQLGEGGAGLSEGQMQRIAIARAIYSESPILLLDEATASLDGETEMTLIDNIRKMTDKTVILITHRPAALDICDRVIHFETKRKDTI